MVALAYGPVLGLQTTISFAIQAVFTGDPTVARAQVFIGGTWGPAVAPTVNIDVAQFLMTGLQPGTTYPYQIINESSIVIASGNCKTCPTSGISLRIGRLSDTHVDIAASYTGQTAWDDLTNAVARIQTFAPDIVINTGDLWRRSGAPINVPFASASEARTGWLAYLGLISSLSQNAAWYNTVGNWDGKNGYDITAGNTFGGDAWLKYWPQDTSQSASGDYYTIQYGDILLIFLNAQSYTTWDFWTPDPTKNPENWTLGTTQLAWFLNILATSTSKVKLVFIHHGPCGAGNGWDHSSIYGYKTIDGVYIGEMRGIHIAMQQAGVQAFFYGHDHQRRIQLRDGITYVQGTSTMSYAQDSKGYETIVISPTFIDIEQHAVSDGSLVASTIIDLTAPRPAPSIYHSGINKVTLGNGTLLI